jgi:hemolysin activation/secretion protein
VRVGGVGSSFLVTPEVPSLPVRGFASGELRGDRGAAGSLEYRFPVWEIDKGPAVFPLYFYRLLGAAFYDSGSAWRHEPQPGLSNSDAFDDDTTLSSIGAEVGLDFFIGYYVPLRYRVGIAVPVAVPNGEDDAVQIYSALGASF